MIIVWAPKLVPQKRTIPPLYGGYYQTSEPPEDKELTHVGPGTAGGEYLRCFWHPVALESEVTDIPLVIRILGEDLVLFRDLTGRYGLLHRRCAHRRASLEYGKCENRGLRCCYHGWLWDVDGRLLEAPAEPENSSLLRRVRQGAYPVEVFKGIVFAYLGPPKNRPQFPVYDTFHSPDTEMIPYTSDYPCNWLQIFENAMDPVHSVFLHTRVNGPSFSEAWGEMSVKEFYKTKSGFYYTNARRVDNKIWVRIHHIILPNFGQAGAVLTMDGKRTRYFGRPVFTRWVVPVDNEMSRVIAWANFSDRSDSAKNEWMTPETIEIIEGGEPRTRPIDEALRKPGDYEAFIGQGQITSHAKEHFATSDKGVVMFRKRLRADIRKYSEGESPYQISENIESPIPTYAGDNVLAVPATTGGDDQALVLDVSRRVMESLLKSDAYRGDERDNKIIQDMKKIETL